MPCHAHLTVVFVSCVQECEAIQAEQPFVNRAGNKISSKFLNIEWLCTNALRCVHDEGCIVLSALSTDLRIVSKGWM